MNLSDSAVSCTPRSQTPQCASHWRIRLRGAHHIKESSAPNFFKKLHSANHTAELSSGVCITLQSQSTWCASYRRVKLHSVHHTVHGVKPRSVHHTAESNCRPHSQNTNLDVLWLLLKGKLGEILLGVNTSATKEKIVSLKC